MALTKFDPNPAFIVVDLQKGPEAHDYSIKNVFPRLGETGAHQEIIDPLTRSF